MKTTVPSVETLEDLGFHVAARVVTQQKGAAPADLRRKLRIAFEHFRVVEPEQAKRFAEKVKDKTFKSKVLKINGRKSLVSNWLAPKYTPIARYPTVPPVHVLEALRKAKELDCFDNFEILTLAESEEIHHLPRPAPKDPVLFGRIGGSDNRYFIAQWDDDVAIEDILREEEG